MCKKKEICLFCFLDDELYERMCQYVMSNEQLDENGYPRPGDEAGQCKFNHEDSKPPSVMSNTSVK